VSDWPPIAEPELLRRLALDDEEFAEFFAAVVAEIPARACDEGAIARAIAYPWERPDGSYLLGGGALRTFAEMDAGERGAALARFAAPGGGRLPLLAIGSNAAPATLQRKLAHFDAGEDRDVLALTGHLHDFDIGVAAQPTLYGSMPATLFPSPGTAVRTTVLWVTPTQFTQLAWSEITYRLGRLGTRFEVDADVPDFDEVVVFVSRFGAFCPAGEPAALAAIPASGRSASELSQEELLSAAARLALGPSANAETLIRAIFEAPAELIPKLVETVRRASLPFHSERWTPFAPGPP
jgi:hypothetical protein